MLDALCEEKCYQTRSEAIRDLIRNTLVQKEWEDLNREMVGTLCVVYNHHHSDLAQKMTEIQHSSLDVVHSSLHILRDGQLPVQRLQRRQPLPTAQ